MEPIKHVNIYYPNERWANEHPDLNVALDRLISAVNNRLQEIDKRLSSAEQNVSDHEQELGKERNRPVEIPKPSLMRGDKIVYSTGDEVIINNPEAKCSGYIEVWRRTYIEGTTVAGRETYERIWSKCDLL